MPDETLRMRAAIDDGFTGPLASLRNQLRSISGLATGRTVAKDWKDAEQRIAGVTMQLKTGLAPVMRGIGISSLGISAGIAGATLGFRSFANSTREMGIFSRQIGISVQNLRKMKVLGEHFGMSWDQAQGSLKSFADNMDQVKRHWGAAYNELRGKNLGDLAEKLAAAPTMEKAVEEAMAGLRKIQNPVRRREVAQLLFGTDMWATIATEASPKLLRQIKELLNAFPKGGAQAADDYALNLLKIQLHLENLRTQGFAPLLPEMSRFLELMTGLGAGGESFVTREAKGLAQALRDINVYVEMMQKGDWKGILNRLFVEPGRQANLTQKETELKAFDKGVADIENGKTPSSPAQLAEIHRRRDEMVREIEKLRKAIEDANKNSSLLQRQSFTGSGSGLPPIVKTSLGGMSGGTGGFRAGASGGFRGGSATGETYGPLPDVPGGVIDRSRFARELEQNPGLREKIMGIAAGENMNPRANIAVLESMMNRAAMAGTTLAAQARLHAQSGINEGGYYAGYNPGALRNPRVRAMIEKSLATVLGGSNVSNYATDNASSWLAAKHKRTGGFILQSEYGQESFFSPGTAGGRGGPRSRTAYEAWRNRIAAEAATPKGNSVPTELRGSARVDINLRGLPAGSQVRTGFDGMFRELNLTRSRPMQTVDDLTPGP